MNLRFQKVVFLFVILFGICSCQSTKTRVWKSDDLLIPEPSSIDSLAFPKEISSDQVAEDIDFLIFTLSTAYGGRKYVPPSSLQKTIEVLKSIPKKSTLVDFHDKIDEALFLIPDNHLKAYYKGKVSVKRHNYESQTVGQVGKNNIRNPQKIWETRIDRIGKQKILYISITRFLDHENKIWKNFISSVTKKIISADKVIIDFRGNTGGDDTIGMELAGRLYGHSFEHPIRRQYRSQTPETVALLTNRLNIEIINLKYDREKIPDYLANDFNDSKARYLRALKGEIPPEFIRTDKGLKKSNLGTGYNKPIYILMDKDCGSSCEFTIAALEWHKEIKKVGENTSGTFHFSNAGIAVLPHSKIKIMIPSQFSEYYDKRFFERVGINPDIQVPAGEDAYSFVQKIILAN